MRGRLTGADWTEATVERAGARRSNKTSRRSPTWRASAAYRLRVAKNLLRRFYSRRSDPAAESRLVGDREERLHRRVAPKHASGSGAR